MSAPHPELLVLAITLIALALAPLASRLVASIGEQISSEIGGNTKDAPGDENEEIRQMIEARAYVLGQPMPDVAAEVQRVGEPALHEEVREVVLALNEQRARAGQAPLDVDAEVVRRMARLLNPN